ncbi:hypothetical protein N7532_009889 [Penicillium argentinense]|uniref:Uncharacterized protein n=1 Tax=Penicillium argentinense TaxID=1131581 RepID=A0A9W9ENI9_9EURO|nr:uncharacterized protein N7532_009889 [Penicillium argentinense]KAJ5085118.1 hypothetical protein N7532_009889 [Penicillium argentinense]
MPPGELPASLVAGKPHPTLNTSGYGGSYHQKNTPTSPEDSLIPFDSPTTRTAGNSPLNHSPLSQEDVRSGRGLEPEQPGYRDRSAARDRSRPNGRPHNKSPGSSRLCQKCNEPLTGQFVRALGGTFHLECFKCQDCDEIVASKFFPVDSEDGSVQYPLCETDYFRRLGLLCHECGGALRGSYITALDRKYHIEHFTCSVCPTVFGAQDSYYEHEGKVYCHFHYSTQFAQRCHGCQTAILKQFVEIFRNGQNQHWHPECYMIHKFWNVRLSPAGQTWEPPPVDVDASPEDRERIRQEEDTMEEKVYNIWSTLSTFEESSAACISDMLLHVSNGAYIDGVLVAKRFIGHVEILFGAVDELANYIKSQGVKDLSYGREAKLLCKKIVAFFSLLSKTQETGVRKLGVTQELLSLVTGLAHYLKLLIRIGLQGALKLERDMSAPDGLHNFLHHLGDLDALVPPEDGDEQLDLTAGVEGLADQLSDCCIACKEPIDDECVLWGENRWHIKPPHLSCSSCDKDLSIDLADALWSENENRTFCSACAHQQNLGSSVQSGFVHVSKLQQFVFLLRVALARLLAVLRAGGTLPHTSDDPNLKDYENKEGHRAQPGDVRRSNTRSMSYSGGARDGFEESSLEQTVGEMRRLRSIRNERALSTTYKKARESRIIHGPEGRSARPGSSGNDGTDPNGNGFQIVEERDSNGETVKDLTFGNQDALTLDDIPRIVAAEQAKEQRPNAFRHAGAKLVDSGEPMARYRPSHGRNMSEGNLNMLVEPATRTKRYFSELTALEYFIVRHVAVLSMEPLLDGQFNMEELLSLIESRKPTIWNIFGRAFKDEKKKGKKKGVFGVALDYLVEKEGTESSHGVGPGALRIPAVVDDAVSAMRQMDMSVEGVFRKNGNIRRLKDISEMIDNRYDQVDMTKESPVQIAALLKKFLREMPDPLMTFKLHRLFVAAQKLPDPEKQKRVLHLTCCLLPKAHRDTMEVLFTFLNWTSSFSHVDEESGSKMDIHNLATVMTPNILYPNAKNSTVDESFLAIEAVNALITYNDTMCEIPEDLQSILSDPTLFKENAEVTTKEILKRYGDIARGSFSTKPENGGETFTITNQNRSNTTPAAARIETDPSQDTAWQMQSSVRHVGGSGHSHSNSTAPQAGFDFGPPQPGYRRERSTSNGSQPSDTQQNLPYRTRPGQGAMGVTG